MIRYFFRLLKGYMELNQKHQPDISSWNGSQDKQDIF